MVSLLTDGGVATGRFAGEHLCGDIEVVGGKGDVIDMERGLGIQVGLQGSIFGWMSH